MDFEIAQMVKNNETEKPGIVEGDDDVFIIPKSGRKLESRSPPFLIKTYEMVDDPETNSYITWNSTGTGFIISDHNKFSAYVLPMLFKTSNFSSFVYQLNNYGFKKTSWDRYEYANQWFQAGKKHWLKNIKRRNQVTEWSQSGKKRARFTPDQNSINGTMETKLDAMINEQNDMQRNIEKLKKSFDNMEYQLASLEIPRFPDLKDERMNNAFILKQFMQQYLGKKKVEARDDNSKRPRLDGSQTTGYPMESTEKTEKLFSSAGDTERSIQDQKVKKTRENTENCQFWKNVLDGDSGLDSNERQGDLVALHSKAMMELDEMMATNIAMQKETLIGKPIDLDGEGDGHFELWS